jgi:hypothetical protein
MGYMNRGYMEKTPVPATTEEKPNYRIKTRIALLGTLLFSGLVGVLGPVGVGIAFKGDGPEPTPQPGEGQADWFNQNNEAITFIKCSGCPKVTSGTVNTGGRCFSIYDVVTGFYGDGENGTIISVNGYYVHEKASCGHSQMNKR